MRSVGRGCHGNTIGGLVLRNRAKDGDHPATTTFLSKRTKMLRRLQQDRQRVEIRTQKRRHSYYYIAGPAANVRVGGSGGLVPARM